jgi:hypothetical protein
MAWKGWLGGLAFFITTGIVLGADGTLYTVRVNAPGAEIRSGPSSDPKLYPTEKLAAGEVVEVTKELPDGWLAIKPPNRSFSWISARFLKNIAGNTGVVVTLDDASVPVYYGSSLLNQPPSVVSTQVKKGLQVLVIGPSRPGGPELGQLMPIEPPPSEVRYLRASAVARTASPGGAAAYTGTNTVAPVAARPDAGPNPEWVRAQELERAGRIPEAIQAYHDLGHAVANTDYPLSVQCANRIAYLNDGQRPGPAPGTFTSPVGSPPPIVPIPSASGPVQAQLVPRSAESTGTPMSVASTARRSVGHLRRSWRCVDCRKAYALEDAQGNVLAYVVPGAGVDLEPFVNSNVELTGGVLYRGDLRNNFMVATSVNALR